ncbi:MAG: helix-turn-helix domain-containing protein [Acidimicrobiales bacterium]
MVPGPQPTGTQAELAKRSHLRSTFVSMVERGRVNPSLGTIVAIAWALGVDPAELVRGLLPPLPRQRRRRSSAAPDGATDPAPPG